MSRAGAETRDLAGRARCGARSGSGAEHSPGRRQQQERGPALAEATTGRKFAIPKAGAWPGAGQLTAAARRAEAPAPRSGGCRKGAAEQRGAGGRRAGRELLPPPPRRAAPPSPLPRPDHRPRRAPPPIRGRRPQPRALKAGAASSSVSERRRRYRYRWRRRGTGFLRPLRPLPAARARGRVTAEAGRGACAGRAREGARAGPGARSRGRRGGGRGRCAPPPVKGGAAPAEPSAPSPPHPGPQAPAREKPRVSPRPTRCLLDRRMRRSATPLLRFPRPEASRSARVSGVLGTETFVPPPPYALQIAYPYACKVPLMCAELCICLCIQVPCV